MTEISNDQQTERPTDRLDRPMDGQTGSTANKQFKETCNPCNPVLSLDLKESSYIRCSQSIYVLQCVYTYIYWQKKEKHFFIMAWLTENIRVISWLHLYRQPLPSHPLLPYFSSHMTTFTPAAAAVCSLIAISLIIYSSLYFNYLSIISITKFFPHSQPCSLLPPPCHCKVLSRATVTPLHHGPKNVTLSYRIKTWKFPLCGCSASSVVVLPCLLYGYNLIPSFLIHHCQIIKEDNLHR